MRKARWSSERGFRPVISTSLWKAVKSFRFNGGKSDGLPRIPVGLRRYMKAGGGFQPRAQSPWRLRRGRAPHGSDRVRQAGSHAIERLNARRTSRAKVPHPSHRRRLRQERRNVQREISLSAGCIASSSASIKRSVPQAPPARGRAWRAYGVARRRGTGRGMYRATAPSVSIPASLSSSTCGNNASARRARFHRCDARLVRIGIGDRTRPRS